MHYTYFFVFLILKVFPSSFGIKAAVGNLKISDDSLPRSHSYFWICDMRNPRGSSFVEVILLGSHLYVSFILFCFLLDTTQS